MLAEYKLYYPYRKAPLYYHSEGTIQLGMYSFNDIIDNILIMLILTTVWVTLVKK